MLRFIFTSCLLFSVICNAATIGTEPIPPSFSVSGFGSSEVYRGQTFRLPPGSPVLANSLKVFIGPTIAEGADFRILITEVNMLEGLHPTNVLFESETLNVSILPLRRTSDEFIVDLKGLLLQPERDYAWIVDHFVAGDEMAAVVSMDTGLGDYSEGTAFSFPNGPFFPDGTREEHFEGNNWFIPEDRDFAFELTFTPVTALETLYISPPSGIYTTTQSFDLMLIIDTPGLSVIGAEATLDSTDVTVALESCIIPGTLLLSGQTFRCPGLKGGIFGTGSHTLKITLNLSNGSSVSNSVIWEILDNSEP